MKVASYDPEKGFSTSLDFPEPNPGTACGVYFATDVADDDEENGLKDDDGNAVVRGIRFQSAPDSNVKVSTSFDKDTGLLTVTIGVYYV